MGFPVSTVVGVVWIYVTVHEWEGVVELHTGDGDTGTVYQHLERRLVKIGKQLCLGWVEQYLVFTTPVHDALGMRRECVCHCRDRYG